MDIDSYNFATETRWVCIIPLSDIFLDVDKNFSLNLTKFTIPEFTLSTVKPGFMGYTTAFPTGLINPEEKQLTFNYLVSSNFKQYITLYRWLEALSAQKIYNPIQTATAVDPPLPLRDVRLPISVILLSEFNKPILRIKYHDCFLSKFDQFQLDYTSETDNRLSHAFTVEYSRFEFFPLI